MHGYNGAPHHVGGGYGQGGYCALQNRCVPTRSMCTTGTILAAALLRHLPGGHTQRSLPTPHKGSGATPFPLQLNGTRRRNECIVDNDKLFSQHLPKVNVSQLQTPFPTLDFYHGKPRKPGRQKITPAEWCVCVCACVRAWLRVRVCTCRPRCVSHSAHALSRRGA